MQPRHEDRLAASRPVVDEDILEAKAWSEAARQLEDLGGVDAAANLREASVAIADELAIERGRRDDDAVQAVTLVIPNVVLGIRRVDGIGFHIHPLQCCAVAHRLRRRSYSSQNQRRE